MTRTQRTHSYKNYLTKINFGTVDNQHQCTLRNYKFIETQGHSTLSFPGKSE